MAESRVISNLSRSATLDDIDKDSLLAMDTAAGETFKLLISVLSPAVLRELFDNYHLRPASKDILSGDQTTDLTVYESGGASEKRAGFRITASWVNGTSAFQHSFNSGLNFLDKNGNVIDPADMDGNGYGYLDLEYDPDNSVWIILNDSDHIFDTYSITDSGNDYNRIVEKMIKNRVVVSGTWFNGSVTCNTDNDGIKQSAGQAVLVGITLSSALHWRDIEVHNVMQSTNKMLGCRMEYGSETTTGFNIIFNRGTTGLTGADCYARWKVVGTWR